MSWLNRLQNHMRLEAQRATADISLPRAGIIRNYDPAHYSARVELQPEGTLTGYLPIASPWVGPQFGFYAGPNIGDVVDVIFQQGGNGAGVIIGRQFNANAQPLAVPSGECWMVHKSGSMIKFTTAGDVIITAARDLIQHGGRRYIFDANGQGQIWNGSSVETWQDNDTPGGHHNHAPPRIPS
jgi:Type VI secretion system/phage-baseplate injector OB domain